MLSWVTRLLEFTLATRRRSSWRRPIGRPGTKAETLAVLDVICQGRRPEVHSGGVTRQWKAPVCRRAAALVVGALSRRLVVRV